MNLQQVTEQTLALAAKHVPKGWFPRAAGDIAKAIDTTTGVKGIDLQTGLDKLVPLMTALRQSIPRSVKAGASASTWKQITKLSMPKPTVAKGAGGPLFTTTVVEVTKSHKVLALGGRVDREAQGESETFESALQLETVNTLLGHQKLEEIYILGGNVTALAAPLNPAVAEVNAVGTIGAVAPFVKIAAITLPAFNRTVQNVPADYDGTHAKLAGTSILAADIDVTATGDGVGPLSAEATISAMTGTDNGVKITWDPVPNAVAYLVFVGTATGNTNLKLEAIVTQTSITLTSLAAGGLLASTLVATSADALSYDGIIASSIAGGAYVKYVNGKLTGTAGEVLELQDAFAALWRSGKLGKFRILVSGDDSRVLTRLGISQNSLNIVVGTGGDGRAQIVMGGHVGQIMNSISGAMCPVETMPWLAPGMILILPTEVPYNDAGITAPFDMRFVYDVERWDYASTRSSGPIWDFDIRNEGVLRPKFPGGCGVLANIFKG